MKFIINYHTGVTKDVEVKGLNEAKEIAVEGISYTQENISIEQDGKVVAVARWYGVVPEEDDEVLEVVGGGFYADWQDV